MFSMHAAFTMLMFCIVAIMIYAAFWLALVQLNTRHEVEDEWRRLPARASLLPVFTPVLNSSQLCGQTTSAYPAYVFPETLIAGLPCRFKLHHHLPEAYVAKGDSFC